MKTFFNISLFIAIPTFLLYLGVKSEQSKDPYEVGMHLDYSIECENGFVYKRHHGIIQVLNSDGTPLKCGEKIY